MKNIESACFGISAESKKTQECLYGRRAADLRRALADRHDRQRAAERWACYVICVRNKKARKVER